MQRNLACHLTGNGSCGGHRMFVSSLTYCTPPVSLPHRPPCVWLREAAPAHHPREPYDLREKYTENADVWLFRGRQITGKQPH